MTSYVPCWFEDWIEDMQEIRDMEKMAKSIPSHPALTDAERIDSLRAAIDNAAVRVTSLQQENAFLSAQVEELTDEIGGMSMAMEQMKRITDAQVEALRKALEAIAYLNVDWSKGPGEALGQAQVIAENALNAAPALMSVTNPTFDALTAILDNPPEPNQKLKELMARQAPWEH